MLIWLQRLTADSVGGQCLGDFLPGNNCLCGAFRQQVRLWLHLVPCVIKIWKQAITCSSHAGSLTKTGNNVVDLFMQLSLCFIGRKLGKLKNSFWLSTNWYIWITRNHVIIFWAGVFNLAAILTHIKTILWQWLLYKGNIISGSTYEGWLRHP